MFPICNIYRSSKCQKGKITDLLYLSYEAGLKENRKISIYPSLAIRFVGKWL
jgi:hypothetical protein